MERPSVLFRISSVIFRCQKYVKKGYIEMTKKIYLETLKSVLGRSIFHWFDFEKVAQISILTNKIVICSKVIIKESKQTIHYICFQFSRYYLQITLLIWWKKLKLFLTVVSFLLKIRFGHAQISLTKIGISMLKTAFINLLHVFSAGFCIFQWVIRRDYFSHF